MEKNDVFSAI